MLNWKIDQQQNSVSRKRESRNAREKENENTTATRSKAAKKEGRKEILRHTKQSLEKQKAVDCGGRARAAEAGR
jgi:undecaprenyl pyrophosphate synthase